MRSQTCLLLFIFLLSNACQTGSQSNTLFSKIPSSQSGIDFSNQLDLNENFDVFRYRNYYNGGGVAIGDINNDGLPDIFLTANTQKNKLYLNLGDLKFKDISAEAGIEGKKAWSTGVSMADVNGDGWLDIYVCNSGNIEGDDKENELYINQKNNTFKESAQTFGLGDQGFSTHAAFLDYDLDGDLDCYLLNNSFRPVGSFGLENIRHVRDKKGGDKLYRNDEGKFVDISTEAGIYGSVIGFGLGIALGDVNRDGWPDIYVSNDFFERDYLYINNQDGTFKESLPAYINHTSEFSMGSDMADLNGDGYPEIFVTDMLPNDDYRLKTTASFINKDIQNARLQNDYYHQFMRNSLQLNNGDGTFSEIGLYAGVASTDWSWGALIADFDNAGDNEIYVTNGIYKDVTDQDFINFLAGDVEKIQKGEKVDFKALVDKMPSNRLPNFIFKKESDQLRFENKSPEWGLNEPSFSNGAAYGDLDNDGDLDLVVNNVNQELFLYRNNTNLDEQKHYLKLSFKGNQKNTFGVGALVRVFTKENTLTYENFPTRGFQSSMDYTATLGLGQQEKIDSIRVEWPGFKGQTLRNVEVDQLLELDIKNAKSFSFSDNSSLDSLSEKITLKPEFIHRENPFIDFDRERLIYHMTSRQGPALAVADLNNDGNEDFFIGGAKDQASRIYLANKGGFINLETPNLEEDIVFEDVDALFFDADGDEDLDLYVVSGGSESVGRAQAYQDRFYKNQGDKNNPRFERTDDLPPILRSGSCVEAADYDKDGDQDLFIGIRGVPGSYGLPEKSFILENDGKGNFKDVTSEKAPQLADFGMVTDAVWTDFDGDQLLDLVVVGEWMEVTVFKNKGVGFQKAKSIPGLENSKGLWSVVESVDLNLDGHPDLILGNLGLNSRFQADKDHPFQLYINDFDENGSLDHIYAHYQGDKLVPFSLKQDLSTQLNYLKKKFLYFKDYADKSLKEVFDTLKLNNSLRLEAQIFSSCIAMNRGDGGFDLIALPEAAQFSPIHSILPVNLDGDENPELVIAGNFSATKPELGNYDASFGLILDQDASGKWRSMPSAQSGLSIRGDIRKIRLVQNAGGQRIILFAVNDDKPIFYIPKKFNF